MLIRGTLHRPRFVPALRFFMVVTGAVTALCAAAFVAGAASYREGRLHEIREWAVGWMHPSQRIDALLAAPDAPVIAINMRFDDLSTLRETRAEALDLGVLITDDDDRVSAVIDVGGSSHEARVRLKGDAVDHLRGKRWSMRVEFTGEGRLWGMRRFSLQHPGTRGFEREWLFHRHLAAEDLLSLRYNFARLVINGKDLGLVAVEEHFGKELLEVQGRREAPIVRFDESGLWERYAYQKSRDLLVPHVLTAQTDAFQTGKLMASPTLSGQSDAAQRALRRFVDGDALASEVFDIDRLGRYLALSELYGSWHALAWHNMRFYYDPVRARLEPIGFDANSNLETTPKDLAALRMPWVEQALRDPELARAYARNIDRLTRKSGLDALEREFDADLRQVVRLLNLEWPRQSAYVWKSLRQRAATLRRSFGLDRLVRGSATGIDGAPLELELYNNLRMPVDVLGVRCGARFEPLAEPITLMPGTAGVPGTPQRITLPTTLGPDEAVRVRARIVGWSEPREVVVVHHRTASVRAPRPTVASVATACAAHDFLRPTDDGARVVPGTHDVTGDLVLPAGAALTLDAGTTLRFDAGATLVVDGPVRWMGTAEAPIRLEPRGETWGGALLTGGGAVIWHHVHVRAATAIERPGWTTTGGITIDRRSAELRHCRFIDARGEDALNVFGSTMHLLDCTFDGAVSDAFDGDYVNGVVARCAFRNVVGDAVDVSSSDVRVASCSMRDVGDKAISAGEQSTVELSGIEIDRARFGVVSKDRSVVRGSAINLVACEIGVAAYRKKPEYGPAEADLIAVRMADTREPMLAQLESRVRTNGTWVEPRDVDVDALYAAETAGAADSIAAEDPS